MKTLNTLKGLFICFLVLCWHPLYAQVLGDPAGDTFGIEMPGVDLVGLEASSGELGVKFDIYFAGTILPPSSGNGSSVIGFLELDTDCSVFTGLPSIMSSFGINPLPAIGVEYILDFESEENHAGFVDLLRADTMNSIGRLGVTYADASLSVVVPRGLVGDASSKWAIALLVGTLSEATDRLPNDGSGGFVAVPESSAHGRWICLMLVFGFGIRKILRSSQ